jgi:hypothetical protein
LTFGWMLQTTSFTELHELIKIPIGNSFLKHIWYPNMPRYLPILFCFQNQYFHVLHKLCFPVISWNHVHAGFKNWSALMNFKAQVYIYGEKHALTDWCDGVACFKYAWLRAELTKHMSYDNHWHVKSMA